MATSKRIVVSCAIALSLPAGLACNGGGGSGETGGSESELFEGLSCDGSEGVWSAPIELGDVLATHAIHLSNGDLLLWSGDDRPDFQMADHSVWRLSQAPPESATLVSVPVPGPNPADPDTEGDTFCSGHVALPDGRVIVLGGQDFGGDDQGLRRAVVFDPVAFEADPQTSWDTNIGLMNTGRWYPTATVLPSGDILAVSGTDFGDTTPIPEVDRYSALTNMWNFVWNFQIDIYPFDFLMPDGTLFYAGAENATNSNAYMGRVIDIDTGVVLDEVESNFGGGSAVQFSPGKILKSGGFGPNSAKFYNVPNATTNLAAVYDHSAGSWEEVDSMAHQRGQHALIALPDGTVLAVNGTRVLYDQRNAVHAAEWFDPDAGEWCELAGAAHNPDVHVIPPEGCYDDDWPDNFTAEECGIFDIDGNNTENPRVYHSSALLLRDGRVATMGGGKRGSLNDRLTAEIFSPPYLQRGPRPTIAAVNGVPLDGDVVEIPYGSTFTVTPGKASQPVERVTLVKLGAITHSFDQDQRFLELECAEEGCPGADFSVRGPVNACEAPPGHYMLFVLSDAGVPSVAKYVRLAVDAGAQDCSGGGALASGPQSSEMVPSK